MSKKLIALLIALSFTAATAVTVSAFTCKVSSIDGKKVVLKCKNKDAAKLEAGDKAKVKRKVEGC